MKPKFFFDYIFYRVTETYLNWKHGDGGVDTGVIWITGIQGFTMASVFAIMGRLYYVRQETAPYAKMLAGIAFGVVLVLLVINSVRYNKERFEALRDFWRDEPLKTRKLRGFLVVLSFIISMVPLILVGVFW